MKFEKGIAEGIIWTICEVVCFTFTSLQKVRTSRYTDTPGVSVWQVAGTSQPPHYWPKCEPNGGEIKHCVDMYGLCSLEQKRLTSTDGHTPFWHG